MKKEAKTVLVVGALVLGAFFAGSTLYKRNQAAEGQQKVAQAADSLVRFHSPTLGEQNARVTIVEFLDPECESCRAMYPAVKDALKQFPGEVRLVVRFMPLHKNSAYAAKVLEAARNQGKFWEALELAFETQPQWADHHTPKPELLIPMLAKIGLDATRLEKDSKDPAIAKQIEMDRQDGNSLGVRGTPSFFVNGQPLQSLGYGPLVEAIRTALR